MKISALTSGKVDKYTYLTDEEILPSNTKKTKEQDNLNLLTLLSEKLWRNKQKQFEDQVKSKSMLYRF